MKIAILGCGPSGLVAAHAASQLIGRNTVQVFSSKAKSPIWGAQYLHQPIPKTFTGHEVEPEIVRYRMVGTPEAYLEKVYGAEWDGTVNDDLRDQAHVAWDLRTLYGELWMRYEQLIIDYRIPSDVSGITRAISPLLENYDLVINTMPRPSLCLRRHRFKSTEIWALGETDSEPFPVRCEDNIIEYNGNREPGYYRASRIFGYSTLEWPGWVSKPPLSGVARVRKPLSHDCNCWLDRIVHLGRMGRWQNGRLVHHVFADMMEQLLLLGAEKGVAG